MNLTHKSTWRPISFSYLNIFHKPALGFICKRGKTLKRHLERRFLKYIYKNLNIISKFDVKFNMVSNIKNLLEFF